MMLYVSCRECREEIPTGIAIGFAGRPVLGAHTYECPGCGHKAEYHGEDYHPPQRPRPTGGAAPS